MYNPYDRMYQEVCAGISDTCDLLSLAEAPLSKMEYAPEKDQLATILRTAAQLLKQSVEKAEEILLEQEHIDPA